DYFSRQPSVAEQLESEAILKATTRIKGIGKLEPASGVFHVFAPAGQKIESLFGLTIGESVEKEQPIIRLAAREVREKELRIAKAKKADADNQLQVELAKSHLKRKAAELSIEQAKALKLVIDSKAKQIGLLEAKLQLETKKLKRLEDVRQNSITKSMVGLNDLESQRLLIQKIESEIQQSRLEVDQKNEEAERAVKAAEIELKSVEELSKNAGNAVPYQSINAAIDAAEMALDMTDIKAPITGNILDIIVPSGDTVTNKPVLVLGDTSSMVCVTEINDVNFRLVNIDDTATISSVALDQPIQGKVISKGSMIGPPSMSDPNPFARVDRKTGRVVIQLEDNEALAGLVNLQVDVEIQIEPENQ
ncbi:MAG: hypothetical protein AAGA30_03355, partial [Planctomycetota bacterium]